MGRQEYIDRQYEREARDDMGKIERLGPSHSREAAVAALRSYCNETLAGHIERLEADQTLAYAETKSALEERDEAIAELRSMVGELGDRLHTVSLNTLVLGQSRAIGALVKEHNERIQALEAANSTREEPLAAERAELQRFKADSAVQRAYAEQDHPKHAETVARFNELQEAAYPSRPTSQDYAESVDNEVKAVQRAEAWKAMAGKLAELLCEPDWENIGNAWTPRRKAAVAEYEAMKSKEGG